MKEENRKPLFSNGTDAERWIEHNCEECIKGVFFNYKTDTMPKYRCAIQKHIDEAWIGDGRGSERDYQAVSQVICPHRKTERPKRKKKVEILPNLFGNDKERSI